MEFVAFIRPKGESGPVHISASPDPHRMLAILQVGNPAELELIGTVDAALYPESWWHDTLSPWRHRDAWYQPKAQVLCRVEDALTGALEAPERFDPLEDPPEPSDGSQAPPDRVPADLRTKTREELVAEKWAWPVVDPYPPVKTTSIPVTRVLPLIRKLLHAAA